MSAEHELTEVRCALMDVCKLLEVAKCPNEGCGGQGWSAHQVAEDVWEQEQCQWCYEKKKLLDEHG